MKQATIVYIVSTLGRTGPTRQLFNLVKHLDRNFFDVHILTLSLEPKDSLKSKFGEIRVNLHCLELTRLASVFFGHAKAKKLLCTLEPDIIHTQGLRADWLSARLPFPHKIATQRNNPFSDYPKLMGLVVGRIAAHLHCYALRQLEVVTCSDSVASLNHGMNIDSNVIRNGVDTSAFKPIQNPELQRAQRMNLGLPPDGRFFIYTGPLIVRKNIEFLIKSIIGHAIDSDYLIILGTGSSLNHLDQIAKVHPNIIFRDPTDNVLPYLQAADYFVSASYDEGLPNSVLEALAAGLPVLLSDISAHREIIKLSPSSGELFCLNRLDTFYRAIDNLAFKQKTENANNAARASAVKYFSAEQMAAGYQRLYDDLLTQSLHISTRHSRICGK